jgi:class 3 adenylate cyclase
VISPETRYARSGDTHIAYQVVGDGPMDLLYIPTWISQVEALWEEPSVARFFSRLATFSRLILFDRRGAGLSDRLDGPVTLDEQMDDVNAVLDAAGSQRTALLAQTEGAAMAVLYAASFPQRTTALVLYAGIAKTVGDEESPWVPTAQEREARMADFVAHWGDGSHLEHFAPSLAGDARMRSWFGRLERLAASPGTAIEILGLTGQVDARQAMPSIQVPTLVIHRTGDPVVDISHSRYAAEHIPGATLKEMPGTDNLIVAGDVEALLDEIEEFLTGVRPQREPDRVLATVMFTDIVGSTERAAELGDRRWRDLLASHDSLVRGQLERHRGREVKTVGDGFLATFDGPARAIRCATAIHDDVQGLGVAIRAGLHTGECEVIGDDVGGMAVHIGARVGAQAKPGEVLVSSTVKDLVVGSGFAFEDRGAHELKGVPGEWRLFAVCE